MIDQKYRHYWGLSKSWWLYDNYANWPGTIFDVNRWLMAIRFLITLFWLCVIASFITLEYKQYCYLIFNYRMHSPLCDWTTYFWNPSKSRMVSKYYQMNGKMLWIWKSNYIYFVGINITFLIARSRNKYKLNFEFEKQNQ